MKRTSDVTGPAPLKTKGEKSCKLHAAICSRPASCARVPPLPQRLASRPPPQSSPSRRSPARSGTRRGGRGLRGPLRPRSKAKEKGAKVLSHREDGPPDCTSAYSSGWIAATKRAIRQGRRRFQGTLLQGDDGGFGRSFRSCLIRAYAEIAGESVDWLATTA